MTPAIVTAASVAASTLTGMDTAPQVVQAPAAMLRGMDLERNSFQDFEVMVGETARFGDLDIKLNDCRYLENNPEQDSYAFLVIHDLFQDQEIFRAWMISSSPALSAIDHNRFDIWLIRCATKNPEDSSR
ncbi:MAG: DUF2155 domain-containing protein [Rhodobacteraceae bacterium]|nr:DUF2155 domain-containing protein [Paracoccaceae bacterium]